MDKGSILYKVLGYSLLYFAIIAIFLYFAGIDKVEFGGVTRSFLNNLNFEMSMFKIEIPSIPEIPRTGNAFIDFFSGIINFISLIVNLIILLINTVFKVVHFATLMIFYTQRYISDLAVSSGDVGALVSSAYGLA